MILNSTQVSIDVVDSKSFPNYLSFFNLLSKNNKNFKVNTYSTIAIVNNNNIDVGVIALTNINDDLVSVELFQAPRVCRLSIISIIEASLVLIKDRNLKVKNIVYKDLSLLYSFKVTAIFRDTVPDESGSLTVPVKLINDLDITTITTKNIIIN